MRHRQCVLSSALARNLLILAGILALGLWPPAPASAAPISGEGTVSGSGGSGSASADVPEPDNWDPTANPSPPPNPANTVTISKTFTALDEIIITLPYNYTGGQGSPSPYTTFVIQESFTNLTGVDLSAVTIELGVIDISGTGFNCTGVAVNFCRDSFGGSTAEFTPFSTVSGLPHFSNVLGISDQATLTGLLANGDVANLLFEVSIPANNPESNWAIRQTVIPEPGTAALLALGLAGLAWFAHR